MAGFAYFIPSLTDKAAAQVAIERHGLGHAFTRGADRARCVFGWNPVAAGPDGAPGAILAAGVEVDGGVAADPLYRPDTQVWQRAPGGTWWLGMDPARPPVPADLERADGIPGHDVVLGDGQTWRVPVLINWDGKSAVPERLGLDEEGEWTSEPLDRYRDVLSFARRIWSLIARHNDLVDGDDVVPELTDTEAKDRAVQMLAVNYRIARVEVARLGLFITSETGTLEKLLEACVDIPMADRIVAALADAKKNDDLAGTPAGSESSRFVPV